MKHVSTKKLLQASLLLALGMVLPFLTSQIPELGRKLLPMHIPVLLAGFVCGWPLGLIVGFILPLFRSVLFGVPVMFPNAVAMAFELAAYGAVAGILYRILPRKNIYIYMSLLLSMICGRIIWGGVSVLLYGLNDSPFSWRLFISGALLDAIPGIVIQIMLIPVLVIFFKQAGIIEQNNA